MDRLLEQLSTVNLAVGVEHESAERGRDDDARVILVARRNRARNAPQAGVAGVTVEVDVICEVPRRNGLTRCQVREAQDTACNNKDLMAQFEADGCRIILREKAGVYFSA